MSPSEVALGVIIIVGVLILTVALGRVNRRRREPDSEDLAVIPEDEIKPTSTDT